MTERRCRVLHVMNGASGGAALSTISLMKSMREHGYEACAVCFDDGTREERERLKDACDGRIVFRPLYLWHKRVRVSAWKRPLIELRQLLNTGASVASVRAVADSARRWAASLFHSNTSLTIEGGIAGQLLGLPHVWHVRELIGAGQPFRFPLERVAFGRLFRRLATAIVANSRATADHLAQLLPRELVSIVENGIDVAAFARPRSRLPNASVRVGMVANLTSRSKKHALFIDAIARLPRDLPLEFSIVGHGAPGPGQAADSYVAGIVARLESEGLRDRVRFTGFISDPADAMATLDVLVHPADNESFGRVVLEAWASGAAVVGVAGGGVGALIDDGVDGVVARVDDPKSLADAILQVASDAAFRERLITTGRARVARDFSLAATAARMADVYRRAMNAGTR